MEMQWHFHAFLLFQRSGKDTFYYLDKHMSMDFCFHLRESSSCVDACCDEAQMSRIPAVEEGPFSPEDSSATPGIWKALIVTASSCAHVCYVMKLHWSPVSGSLISRKQPIHIWWFLVVFIMADSPRKASDNCVICQLGVVQFVSRLWLRFFFFLHCLVDSESAH